MIKKIALLLMICILLPLTACSLAKPEKNPQAETADRFIGVYIVDDEQANGIYEKEGWVGDGVEEYEMDSVNIPFLRLIYKAEYVEEEHRYVFPGLKGYALFAAKVGQGQDAYTTTCSDLEHVNVKFHTRDADTSLTQIGDEDAEFAGSMTDYDLTGTLYIEEGSFAEDQCWRLMNVFQKPDGTVYLDGTGDGFAIGGTVSLEMKNEQTVNGKKIDLESTKVTVALEEAKQADTGIVYWYNGKGELLSEQILDPKEVTELTWHNEAAWLVYEERFGEEIARTLHEKGTEGEAVSINIMTINEDGIGRIKTVEIQ